MLEAVLQDRGQMLGQVFGKAPGNWKQGEINRFLSTSLNVKNEAHVYFDVMGSFLWEAEHFILKMNLEGDDPIAAILNDYFQHHHHEHFHPGLFESRTPSQYVAQKIRRSHRRALDRSTARFILCCLVLDGERVCGSEWGAEQMHQDRPRPDCTFYSKEWTHSTCESVDSQSGRSSPI